MSRVLVTGAAGFIGSHVTDQLLEAGHDVRALLLPGESRTNLAHLEGELELVEGDVRDANSIREHATGCDAVMHLASLYAVWAPDPGVFESVNVEGTRTVLEAARAAGVGRVVVTTSQAVWAGQHPSTVIDESLEPDREGCLSRLGDLYCQSKLATHRLCLDYASQGHDVVMVAPTVPFGPRDTRPTPTGQILTSVATLPAFTFVESVINPVDVRDVARGHLLAWEKGRTGESYLLGGPDNVGMRDVIAAVRAVTGRWRPAFPVPYLAAAAGAHLLRFWADHVSHRAPPIAPGALRVARLGFRIDASKARDELGLDPRPWRESVRDALHWFAEHGHLGRRTSRRLLSASGAPARTLASSPPRSASGTT